LKQGGKTKISSEKIWVRKAERDKAFYTDPSKKAGVEQFFAALKEIGSLDDLYKGIKEYCKRFKKTDEQLISIATILFMPDMLCKREKTSSIMLNPIFLSKTS
jgi:predicted transcriptional regulator